MNIETDDAEFEALAATLRDEFAGLTYDATLHVPARGSSLAKGGAVALAVALTATVMYNRSDERPAWASTPESVSPSDLATVKKLCADNSTIRTVGPDVQVKELPPLVSVDARGERVFAVFSNDPTSISPVHVFTECVLNRENGQLVLDPNPPLVLTALDAKAATVVTDPAVPGTTELSVELTSTIQPSTSEEAVMFAMGSVGSDVTRVALSGAGGPTAEASVDAGRYSIWWPRSTYAGTTKLTAYRADGTTAATVDLPDFSNFEMCPVDESIPGRRVVPGKSDSSLSICPVP